MALSRPAMKRKPSKMKEENQRLYNRVAARQSIMHMREMMTTDQKMKRINLKHAKLAGRKRDSNDDIFEPIFGSKARNKEVNESQADSNTLSSIFKDINSLTTKRKAKAQGKL
jgi:hypothetical protein